MPYQMQRPWCNVTEAAGCSSRKKAVFRSRSQKDSPEAMLQQERSRAVSINQGRRPPTARVATKKAIYKKLMTIPPQPLLEEYKLQGNDGMIDEREEDTSFVSNGIGWRWFLMAFNGVRWRSGRSFDCEPWRPGFDPELYPGHV
ncbi:hypothetical protein Bbelb_241240 [Branchiostoma belcheri]|nr:hypothetical protein Bbelb_241240 [Branchiostoma belcheri]